jgi:hypothetical protein
MTDIAEQLNLALPRKPQVVDIEAIRRQPTMTKAIILAVDLAGFVNDKDLCRSVDLDPAVWARIKNGQANFPHDKLNDLCDQAGNEVPLVWWADRRGYLLTPKESELEKRLRIEREEKAELQKENAILRSVITSRAA